jgi:hypothetical protein
MMSRRLTPVFLAVLMMSTATVLMMSAAAVVPPRAEAAPKPKPRPTSISLIPTIESISVQNGQLVAAGFVRATIKGTTTTVPFSGVPVDLSLAADQSAATDCPILNLTLGPIDLNLLGLEVETSRICLEITAHANEGLLGDLLCAVAHLLDGGLTLSQILAGLPGVDPDTGLVVPGLTPGQILDLPIALANLLNAALGQLYQAVLTAITQVNQRGTCAILHLELGPLDLTLLGLQVVLDNCNGGPVTVDITGHTGPGNLLGNLLCQLLGGGLINLGATLQQILNQIVGLLTL